MKQKKNITLDPRLIMAGTERANELGYSFSGYITYLINKDIDEVKNNKDSRNNYK